MKSHVKTVPDDSKRMYETNFRVAKRALESVTREEDLFDL